MNSSLAPARLLFLCLPLVAGHFAVLPAYSQGAVAARMTGDVLKVLNEVNSIVGVLDGSGDMPEDTIQTLEDQIATLEAEAYGPMTYALEDYALSVGAIVGEGDGIIAEIDGVLALSAERRRELDGLNVRDAELAEVETRYAIADRAVTDAMQVFEEYFENGGMAADQMAGYPVFNNWQVLHNDIAPRFSDRLSEMRRVRSDIGVYRQHLYRHVKESEAALKGFASHVNRIREFRESQAVQSGDNSKADWLEEMRERGAMIEATANKIVSENQATREQVKRIQEAQAKSMQEADLLNDILAVVQAGLAVTGANISADNGSSGTASSKPPQVAITIETTTTNVTLPDNPIKPVDGIPIGGSGL